MTGWVRAAIVALFVAAAWAITGVPAAAQSSSSSTLLEGTVRDQSGAVVAGATVSVQAVDSAWQRFVDTARDGRFRLTGLPAGRYVVLAAASGFAAESREVTIPAEGLTEFELAPAAVVEQVRVVSASRQDELRETLNTRVDVLTRSRILDTGAQTVSEVLREVPGVLTRRGSEGSAGGGGQQIQGVDSRQVLVLMDGLPLVGARGIKSGVVNLDRQSTDRLERIEVVKGASSALYGSDAIGGVINLIPRRAQSPLDLGASLSGGSNGDFNGTGEGGFLSRGWSGFFTFDRHHADGFDLTPTTVDTTAPEFRRNDGFGRIEYTPQSALTVSGLFTGYRNRANGRSTGELGPQADDIRDSTFNSAVTANWLATPLVAVQVRGYHARYAEDSNALLADGSTTIGALDERLSRVDGSVSYVLGSRQHLQGGAEYTRDEYAGINRLRNDSGEHVSTGVAWGQHRLTIGDRVTTTLGARVDNHSIFGTAFSPKAGVNVRLIDAIHARASYGRGFRAPDVGQLYYRFFNPTNFYQVLGNEHLEPEYANSVQLGAEALFFDRRARFGVNVFRNDVRDLISAFNLGVITSPAQLEAVLAANGLEPSSAPVFGRQLFIYRNVQDAVTEGVEVDGEVAILKNLSFAGAYTYLDARDDTTDLALTGRHPHQGFVRLAWSHDRVGLRANLRGSFYSEWVNTRAASGAETIGEGFQLWDAFVSQRIVRDLVAFVAVDNIADNQDPNVGVPQANGSPASILRPEVGRTARFGLRWNWSR